MARFATDFSEFAPGLGLPAGFSTSGDPGLYSVAAVAGSNVLRIGPLPNGSVRTFWDAAGAAEDAELYIRARWTNAETESYFDTFPGWSNVPLGAVLHGGDTFLRIAPPGVEAQQAAAVLLSGGTAAASALVGHYHIVLRYHGGAVYGAVWADGVAPPRAWNYILDAGPAISGLLGFLTAQWLSTVEVLFLGAGTDGDDAPRTLAAVDAPRRPSPSVASDAGAATLSAGTAAAATRFCVYDLPLSARYSLAGATLQYDTGWQEESSVPYTGARTDREYGLEVTVRDADGVESAPSMVEWFVTGEAAGRVVEGLYGFDLYGHRPGGCTDGVSAPDSNGFVGVVEMRGMPSGFGVIIERAGGALSPMLPNPFGGEYASPVEATLSGNALVPLPADAVAVRVYSRRRRQQGSVPVQYLDVAADRDLLLSYTPEHGPQPGDVYLWTSSSAPAEPVDVAAAPLLDQIRFSCGAYAGAAAHLDTRWRVWSRFGTCPLLVYDSGWTMDRLLHSVPLSSLPAGFSTFVTATFRDSRGILSPASEPEAYRVPLALFYGAPPGGLERRADFQTGADEYQGTSSERRPDAISLDYLTAFCVGPEAQGDASFGLFRRGWRARCVNGEAAGAVWLSHSSVTVEETRAGAVGTWEAETLLFIFPGAAALEVDVAFEQSGRAVVCLERPTGAGGAPETWLYWYDPRVPGFTLTNLGPGRNPRILLDNPLRPEQSDVLLFSISDPNDRLEMRMQGEFYAVPHATPIEGVANVYCEEVAFARDNRMHVVLSVRDVSSGRYALAALESAPYPVQMHEALDVRMALASGNVVREGYVVQPGGVENTSDIDALDVSSSIASMYLVELLIVTQSTDSLDVSSSLTGASVVDLTLSPPVTMEALDIRHALTSATSSVYIIYPPVQGPESLDIRSVFTSASAVAL